MLFEPDYLHIYLGMISNSNNYLALKKEVLQVLIKTK